jgi:hypothetical protein
MKKLILLSTLCLLLLTLVVNAQIPPNAFNYSAVARNAAGQPIANTTIGIQTTIIQTSTTGTSQYSENHFVNTDAFGLFNLVIGAGAVQSGSMAVIDWSNDNYYLKIGMDATGGTNFLTMGTTQLLSVPYALHAATADSLIGGVPVFSGDYNDLIDTPSLSAVAISGDYTDLINKPITINSIAATGDTLYLSNGQTFVASGNSSNNGGFVSPTITTNAVLGITSNSATFGGAISNANGNQIMERGIVYSTTPHPTFNSNKIVIGNGIGAFDTITALGYQNAHLLQPNTTYYVRAYALTENNIYAYGNEVSFTTLPVGQVGPGGGIVFFDKGNATGGWQYLETATTDQSTGIGWGCFITVISGTQLAVGSGEANTALIVAGCTDPSFAAKLCDTLTLGGQTDWFLPSGDELNLMYNNLHLNNQANFSGNAYWSSSEENGYGAWFFNLGSGSLVNSNGGFVNKSSSFYVRAIRAF